MTLYRQDLDEILQIIQGTPMVTGRPFEIRSGDFIFDSLEELKQERGPIIRHLEIIRSEWTMEIQSRYVALIGREPDDERVKNLLMQRKRPLGGVSQAWARSISIAGGLMLLGLLVRMLLTDLADRWFMATVPLAVLMSAASLGLPPRSRVMLVRRHEHSSFWKRHAAEFLKAGLTLGGTVIGYLIRLIQEYYSTPCSIVCLDTGIT